VFTIRQHGYKPVNVTDTAIEIIAPDGTRTRFPGRRVARQGRYAAQVVFPTPGTWRWRVIQGWFGPQGLGKIIVRSAGEGNGPPALDGRSLFSSKGCASCHTGLDTTSTFGAGPPLDTLLERYGRKAGLAYIRQSILTPRAVIAAGDGIAGGLNAMPKLEVTRAEAEAIARYLLGKPKR
jgi:cytochrome c551/c552